MSINMKFEVFTIFPRIVTPYLNESILKRAQENGIIDINVHDIRNWTTDKHNTTDALPYGGGGGMVMKPEPLFSAVEDIVGAPPTCPVILLSPQGGLFNQTIAKELSVHKRLAFICGRYEGVDERVRQHLVTDEISIGDFVLTGGELPAMAIIDSVSRLLPGVLGAPNAAAEDSHANGLLEGPHYTRPAEFRGWKVPDILTSGDHKKVAKWRWEQSILRTFQRRPELLESSDFSDEDQEFIDSLT